MWVYIAKRLMWVPVVMLAVSLITFALGTYGPGDPAQVILGSRSTPENVERLRKQMGLDRPFIVQYGDYIWHAIQGDFGESYTFRGQPVASLLARKIWVSMQIGIAATALSVSLGIPLGLLVAYRQGTWVDTTVVSIALLFYSIPVFLSAPFLIWLLALHFHILPTSGWDGFFSPSLVMPAIVMGLPGVAFVVRLTRSSVLEVLYQDYIRTARAKGLPEGIIRFRHVLRNAMIPIVTALGFGLAGLLAGALFTETIFGIPGVGRLAIDSLFNRDYPVIMAGTLLGATMFIVANLVSDLLYVAVDPRIRYT